MYIKYPYHLHTHTWFWSCHGMRSSGRISSTAAQWWLDLPHLGPHQGPRRRAHHRSNPWGKARQRAGDGGMMNFKCIRCIYRCYIWSYVYYIYRFMLSWRSMMIFQGVKESKSFVSNSHMQIIYMYTCVCDYICTSCDSQVSGGKGCPYCFNDDFISFLSGEDYAFSLARKYAADGPLWRAFCAGAPLAFAQTWLRSVSYSC